MPGCFSKSSGVTDSMRERYVNPPLKKILPPVILALGTAVAMSVLAKCEGNISSLQPLGAKPHTPPANVLHG